MSGLWFSGGGYREEDRRRKNKEEEEEEESLGIQTNYEALLGSFFPSHTRLANGHGERQPQAWTEYPTYSILAKLTYIYLQVSIFGIS